MLVVGLWRGSLHLAGDDALPHVFCVLQDVFCAPRVDREMVELDGLDVQAEQAERDVAVEHDDAERDEFHVGYDDVAAAAPVV